MLGQYDIARWQWPGAEVVAGTFDDWWAAFQDAIPFLPVTSQEMVTQQLVDARRYYAETTVTFFC